MKKIFAIVAVASFALAMVSCGGNKKAAAAEAEATEAAVEVVEEAAEAAAEVVEEAAK